MCIQSSTNSIILTRLQPPSRPSICEVSFYWVQLRTVQLSLLSMVLVPMSMTAGVTLAPPQLGYRSIDSSGDHSDHDPFDFDTSWFMQISESSPFDICCQQLLEQRFQELEDHSVENVRICWSWTFRFSSRLKILCAGTRKARGLETSCQTKLA